VRFMTWTPLLGCVGVYRVARSGGERTSFPDQKGREG
jgi:hypothetical protein